ncbi:MAG: ACT domain-containing protein [Eubacterium sp.]
MGKVNYYLIDSSILPEVYSKVILAKGLIASGEASSATQAAKMAGISRSAYYKYKDKIFEYSEQGEDTATINAKLLDNAGVLSSVMNELYIDGANVLSVNQSIPVNGVADVSITVRIANIDVSNDSLLEKIKGISGVKSVELV